MAQVFTQKLIKFEYEKKAARGDTCAWKWEEITHFESRFKQSGVALIYIIHLHYN